jgi:hypothetical protein
VPRPCAWLCLWFLLPGCASPRRDWCGLYEVSGAAHSRIPWVVHRTSPVTARWRVSEGTAVDLLLSDVAGGCSLRARIDGERAVLDSRAVCEWHEKGVRYALSKVQGTFVLSEGRGHLALTGRVTAFARGALFPGEFSQNVTLTRVGP